MIRSLLCSVLLIGLVAQANAAHVHVKSGPVITTSPTSVQVDVCFAGLGNKDIEVRANVTGFATVVLINPGGNFVPGQNKVPINATASVTISKDAIKNGNVCVSLQAFGPLTVDPVAAGAPNPNWTARVVSIDFVTVNLVVFQGGKEVFNQTFQLTPNTLAATQIVQRQWALKQ